MAYDISGVNTSQMMTEFDPNYLKSECMIQVATDYYHIDFKCLRQKGIESLADQLYVKALWLLVWFFIASPLIRYMILRSSQDKKLPKYTRDILKDVWIKFPFIDYMAVASFLFFIVYLRFFG